MNILDSYLDLFLMTDSIRNLSFIVVYWWFLVIYTLDLVRSAIFLKICNDLHQETNLHGGMDGFAFLNPKIKLDPRACFIHRRNRKRKMSYFCFAMPNISLGSFDWRRFRFEEAWNNLWACSPLKLFYFSLKWSILMCFGQELLGFKVDKKMCKKKEFEPRQNVTEMVILASVFTEIPVFLKNMFQYTPVWSFRAYTGKHWKHLNILRLSFLECRWWDISWFTRYIMIQIYKILEDVATPVGEIIKGQEMIDSGVVHLDFMKRKIMINKVCVSALLAYHMIFIGALLEWLL